MKKIRTFKCVKCYQTETKMVEDGIEEIECVECDGKAKLTLSAPKYFGNSVGRSPSAV